MSIEITLKFGNVADAVAALSLLGPTDDQKPKVVKIQEYAESAGAPLKEVTGAGSTSPAAFTATGGGGSTNGAAAPAAATAGEPVTIEQANAAFRVYLAKGQGRTAKVAMDTILAPLGLKSLKEATPEQLAAAKAAFEAATQDKAA